MADILDSFILKNRAGSDKIYEGIPFADGSDTTINDDHTIRRIAENDDFQADVTAGDIIVNDGTADLSAAEALKCFRSQKDRKVQVSSNDTTENYLLSKLTAGNDIALTEVNDGGDETIRIDAITLAGAQGELAALQVRRTTDYAMTASFADVTFDTTDIENAPTIIEHNDTSTDRIDVKEAGLYLITYTFTNNPTSGTHDVRMRRNDLTVIPGSERMVQDSNDTAEVSQTFIANLGLNDFLSLQMKTTGTSDAENIVVAIVKLDVIRTQASCFDVYDGTGGQTFSTSPITLNLDTIRTNQGSGVFNLANDEVTVNIQGYFYVEAQATIDSTVGFLPTVKMTLERDTGSGFVAEPGMLGWSSGSYSFTGTAEDTVTRAGILLVQPGDKFRIKLERSGGTQTLVTVAESSSLVFHDVKGGEAGPQGPAGPPGTEVELPAVQVHRSSAFDITSASYVDVTYDTKDIENDDTILEHDDTNMDRIQIKADGLYYIEVGGQGFTDTTRDIEGRLRLNDTTVVPGSEWSHRDASGGANGYEYRIGKGTVFSASAGDFLSVQVKVSSSASAGDVQLRQACVKIFKLKGSKGDTGPTGSGSNIIVKEGNVSIPNTPHSILDFDADDFDVSDEGSGRALVSLSSTTLGGDSRKLFYADQFDNPINSDWTVNALAPAVRDNNNNALVVRAFDDGTEEGVGWLLSVPTGATQMKLSFKSRAKDAPSGGAKEVAINLYTREIPDDAAVGAWSTQNNINNIVSLPVSATNYQYDETTLTLSTMTSALTAGRLYQFELTRDTGAASDTLVGDWYLLELIVEFL